MVTQRTPHGQHGHSAYREWRTTRVSTRQSIAGHDVFRSPSSPLQRAQRTCELAGLGPVSQVEPAITEWACGDYEGRTPADILAERPDWNLFEQGCPAGESPEQISHRADLVIARLRSAEGNVALFSHSHFLRALAVRWIGLPVGEGRHLVLSTGSLSILSHESNDPQEPAISLWNAVSNEVLDLVSRQPSIADGQVSLPWCDNHEN